MPTVIGHRGAAGRAPENTLAGFRCAKSLGCDWIEFDVRLTADGTLVVCHDSRLDRTTDTTGRIATMMLPVVRQSDAGSSFDAKFAGARGFVDAILTPEETRDTLAFLLEVSNEFTGPHLGAFALPSVSAC